GLRSIQATFMVSLFFGELYRASGVSRVALVLSGAVIAFLCNVGRTFFLAAIGARYGVEAISKWHDPLGNAILTACFLSVWLLAHFISGPLPKLPSSKAPAPIPFPWKSALGLGIWVLFTVVAIEFWYRAHETQNRLHWSFLWPA